MRTIRIADARDRAPQPVVAPRDRRREVLATLPMLLLVPALVFAFSPASARSEHAAKGKDGHASASTTVVSRTAKASPSIAAKTSTKATATTTTTKAATTTATTSTSTRTTVISRTTTATTTTTSSDYILISRAALMARPTSGTSWTTLKKWADKPVAVPNLSDQNDQDDVVALAKAMVFARTGVDHYRTEAIAMLKSAKGTELAGGSLAEARNVAPLALAADFAGWHDATWTSWLAGLRTWKNPDRGYSLITIHAQRPNNWGTHSGASRIAVDLYIGDRTDLAKAAAVFSGWAGDRSMYAGFKYGELSWQANPAAPVGVDPVGARVDGMNVDGILPDDMRRGGSATTVGADGVSYTWEALQGALLQATLLRRAGYEAFSWGDQALRRAVVRMYALGHPAAGDDDWQPWLVNSVYGTHFATAASTHPGKAFGFADWLWG